MASNPAATPQPAPTPGKTNVLPLVLADLQARAAMGLQKYGVPLQVENGRDHYEDMYQEELDKVMYMRAELEMRRGEKAQEEHWRPCIVCRAIRWVLRLVQRS